MTITSGFELKVHEPTPKEKLLLGEIASLTHRLATYDLTVKGLLEEVGELRQASIDGSFLGEGGELEVLLPPTNHSEAAALLKTAEKFMKEFSSDEEAGNQTDSEKLEEIGETLRGKSGKRK